MRAEAAETIARLRHKLEVVSSEVKRQISIRKGDLRDDSPEVNWILHILFLIDILVVL